MAQNDERVTINELCELSNRLNREIMRAEHSNDEVLRLELVSVQSAVSRLADYLTDKGN